MTVEFLRSYSNFNRGEIASLTIELETTLIAQGIAKATQVVVPSSFTIVNQTFTAVNQKSIDLEATTFNLYIEAVAFVGTLAIDRMLLNGNYQQIAAYTIAGVYTIYEPGTYRMRVSAFTSGNMIATMSSVDAQYFRNVVVIQGNSVAVPATLMLHTQNDPNHWDVVGAFAQFYIRASDESGAIKNHGLFLTENTAGFVNAAELQSLFNTDSSSAKLNLSTVAADAATSTLSATSGNGGSFSEVSLAPTDAVATLRATATNGVGPTVSLSLIANATNSGAQITDGAFAVAESATAPAIGVGGTVTTRSITVARLAPAGAVTGVILQAGDFPGQELTVINQSAAISTITFAAAGTSLVADGVTAVLAGLRSMKFSWNSVTNLWYRS